MRIRVVCVSREMRYVYGLPPKTIRDNVCLFSVLQKRTHARAQAAFFQWARIKNRSIEEIKNSFYLFRYFIRKREGEREISCLSTRERNVRCKFICALAICDCNARRECNLNSVFFIFAGRVTQPLKFFSMFLLYSVDIL